MAAQENLTVRVVGGAHLVEGFSGSFQFYHDPNYTENLNIVAVLSPAKEYAVVKTAPPSPWSP